MASSMTPEDFRGRRLLPTLIDEISKRDPEKVWASVPQTAQIEDGFRDISYSQLARAIDFTARWTETTIGRSSSFEAVAYFGYGH